MEYKARFGYLVTISEGSVILSKGAKEISFRKSEISEVELTSSGSDIPFLESSVLIRLKNKKKYKIRRLGRGKARQLYRQLS